MIQPFREKYDNDSDEGKISHGQQSRLQGSCAVFCQSTIINLE